MTPSFPSYTTPRLLVPKVNLLKLTLLERLCGDTLSRLHKTSLAICLDSSLQALLHLRKRFLVFVWVTQPHISEKFTINFYLSYISTKSDGEWRLPCFFNWKGKATFLSTNCVDKLKVSEGVGSVRGNSQTQAHLLGSHKGYTSHKNPKEFVHNVNEVVDQVKLQIPADDKLQIGWAASGLQVKENRAPVRRCQLILMSDYNNAVTKFSPENQTGQAPGKAPLFSPHNFSNHVSGSLHNLSMFCMKFSPFCCL